ncbi:unnamed protein product [Chrysoparadoxa australica]
MEAPQPDGPLLPDVERQSSVLDRETFAPHAEDVAPEVTPSSYRAVSLELSSLKRSGRLRSKSSVRAESGHSSTREEECYSTVESDEDCSEYNSREEEEEVEGTQALRDSLRSLNLMGLNSSVRTSIGSEESIIIEKPEVEENIPFEAVEDIKYLTRGGMANVFTCRYKGWNCAMKTPITPERGGPPTAVNDFQVELLLMQELSHKHICAMHGSGHTVANGEFTGEAFMLLELLPRGSLRDVSGAYCRELHTQDVNGSQVWVGTSQSFGIPPL